MTHTRENGDIADQLRMAATEAEKADTKAKLLQVYKDIAGIADSVMERIQS